MTESIERRVTKLPRLKAPVCYFDTRSRLPYEVVINLERRGRFDNLLDAVSSAQIAKRESPHYSVMVRDANTDHIVVDVDS